MLAVTYTTGAKMDILLIILVFVFWMFMLGYCASLAWDSAKANQAFRYTFYLMGVTLCGNIAFWILVKGL